MRVDGASMLVISTMHWGQTCGMSRRPDQMPLVGSAKPPGRGIFSPLASTTSPPVAKAFLFFWSTSTLGSTWNRGLGFLHVSKQISIQVQSCSMA